MGRRIKYIAAVVITIALGLGSRKFSGLLPDIIAEHAGDMLWASMVYYGFRFILTEKRLLWAAWGSMAFSFGIEFSQLYQADWIVALRNTLLGSLVLGKGFLVVDLFRYLAGIAIAFGVDKYGLNRKDRDRRLSK